MLSDALRFSQDYTDLSYDEKMSYLTLIYVNDYTPYPCKRVNRQGSRLYIHFRDAIIIIRWVYLYTEFNFLHSALPHKKVFKKCISFLCNHSQFRCF